MTFTIRLEPDLKEALGARSEMGLVEALAKAPAGRTLSADDATDSSASPTAFSPVSDQVRCTGTAPAASARGCRGRVYGNRPVMAAMPKSAR